MKATLTKILRGPLVSRLLKAGGINPRHYWLLMDLFGKLSERHEFMSQLGRSGFALKTMAWWFLALSVLFSLLFLLTLLLSLSKSSISTVLNIGALGTYNPAWDILNGENLKARSKRRSSLVNNLEMIPNNILSAPTK